MLAQLRSMWRGLRARRHIESAMDEELRFHLEAYAADLIRSGADPAEARRVARLHFGSLEATKEECREARGLRWADELARNLRIAFRGMRKSPGFTAVVIATLSLCIGANTAVYSLVDALLFRPVPYPEPDRLAQVVTRHGKQALRSWQGQDGAAWEALKRARSFEVAAESGGFTGVNLVAAGGPLYVQQHRVSTGYFRMLGIALERGREFSVEEDRTGGPGVAIVSHELCLRLFNGIDGAAGKTILLKGEPHTVTGVLPQSFRPMAPADVWTPLRPSPSGEGGGENYLLTARLRPGFAWPQARSEAATLGAKTYRPGQFGAETEVRMDLLPLGEARGESLRVPALILWGAVFLVLLIGCVNIASLMLARAGSRTREMGTRVALGGGRGAVIRQLLTESLALAALGGGAGVLLGYLGIEAMAKVAPEYGIWQGLRLDLRVLSAMVALSVATSLSFGLAPAWRASRVDVRGALTESGSRSVAGRRPDWMRRTLVASEVALGLVLLVGAGLLMRTLLYLRSMPPGFDGRGVVAASVSLQDARYRDLAAVNRLYARSLHRIRETPGVEAASVALHVPYERWLNVGVEVVEGGLRPAAYNNTTLNYVAPQFFETLRIPLRSGRLLDERDTAGSAPVTVVNEAFVRRYFGDRPAVGSHIRLRMEKQAREIVGVVGDVQQRPSIGNFGPIGAVYAAYIPAEQFPGQGIEVIHTWFAPSWIVRGSLPRQEVAEVVRRGILAVDPLLPVSRVRELEEERDGALSLQRLSAVLLGGLSVIAVLLAVIGVYGLVSNSVMERTRELGIRMAFGASTSGALLTAVRPGILMAGVGVAAGAVLAAAGSRVLASLLYGVQRFDTLTFAGVSLLLLVVASLASVIPALRVLRLDPARALRDE